MIAFGCRTSSLGASERASICFCEDTFIRGGCKNTTALGTVVGESQRMYPPTLFLKQKLTKNAMSVGLHGKEGTKKEGCIIMCTWLQWFVTS